MTHGDREPNGQWRGPFQISPLAVTRSKDREDQDEGDEKLHPEGLGFGQRLTRYGGAEAPPELGGRYPFQEACPSDGPEALHHDVEKPADQADLASDQHCHRNGGVDVSTADVPNAPDHCGHAQAEAQSNLNDGGVLVDLVGFGCPPRARATPYEDQEAGAEKFGHSGPPEAGALQVVVAGDHDRTAAARHVCVTIGLT